MHEITILNIEVAVARFFNSSIHLILPNASWGLGIHECDLLVLTRCGYANEVEIKISVSDLKRDLLKQHGHRSNLIKRLFFAIPESLSGYQDLIPERAGILIVSWSQNLVLQCRLVRKAEINGLAKPFTNERILQFGRLAAMRIWSLKETIMQRQTNAL